jgi:hypothetical protein
VGEEEKRRQREKETKRQRDEENCRRIVRRDPLLGGARGGFKKLRAQSLGLSARSIGYWTPLLGGDGDGLLFYIINI